MIKKVMKLVDPKTGEMECKVCGATHWALLKYGGRFYHGAWQCKNGCTLDYYSTIERDGNHEVQDRY